MHHYNQTANKPPLAKSGADSDLFDAARARAEFWGYQSNNWTVDVEIPNLAGNRSGKVVQVRSANGTLSIVPPRPS